MCPRRSRRRGAHRDRSRTMPPWATPSAPSSAPRQIWHQRAARRRLLADPAVPLERHPGFHAIELPGRSGQWLDRPRHTRAGFRPGQPARFRVGGPVYIPKINNGKNSSSSTYPIASDQHRSSQQHAHLYRAHGPGADGRFFGPAGGHHQSLAVHRLRPADGRDGERPRNPHAVPQQHRSLVVADQPDRQVLVADLYPLPNNPSQWRRTAPTTSTTAASPTTTGSPIFINRYDYDISDRQRLNGKWYFNHRFSDQYDWAHATPLKGVMSNGLCRPTRGGSLDYLYTISANNVLDITFSLTQYSEGDKKPIDFKYNATAVGLPAYIDQKAGRSGRSALGQYRRRGQRRFHQFRGSPGPEPARHHRAVGCQDDHHQGQAHLQVRDGDPPLSVCVGEPAAATPPGITVQQHLRPAGGQFHHRLHHRIGLCGVPDGPAELDHPGHQRQRFLEHALPVGILPGRFPRHLPLRLGFGLRFEHEGATPSGSTAASWASTISARCPRTPRPCKTPMRPCFPTRPTPPTPPCKRWRRACPPAPSRLWRRQYLGQQYSNFTQGTKRFLPNVSLVYQINSKTVLRIGTGWIPIPLTS